MKHATRLHHCHNDYILATVEANYQHQASLEKIMPHLLDAQQELQECYVEDWLVHFIHSRYFRFAI